MAAGGRGAGLAGADPPPGAEAFVGLGLLSVSGEEIEVISSSVGICRRAAASTSIARAHNILA